MMINDGHCYTSILLSEDEKYAITSSTDHKIRLWDTQNKCRTKVLHGHTDIITTLHFDKENVIVVSGSLDGTIRIWNIKTFVCEKIIKLKKRKIRHIDIIDLKKFAIVTSHNGYVMIIDLKTEKIRWSTQFFEEIICVYWFKYPSKIVLVTTDYMKIINLFWKYI